MKQLNSILSNPTVRRALEGPGRPESIHRLNEAWQAETGQSLTETLAILDGGTGWPFNSETTHHLLVPLLEAALTLAQGILCGRTETERRQIAQLLADHLRKGLTIEDEDVAD